LTTYVCFVKIWTKETRWKFFMLVYFENFDTWNVQITLQTVLHISLIWNIFKLYNTQTIYNVKLNPNQWHINLLIHQKVCANPNTTYLPPKRTCSLGIETIWSSPLFILFKIVFYFHSLFQPLTFKTILATYIIKLHYFPL
jgi:hypothetical protein